MRFDSWSSSFLVFFVCCHHVHLTTAFTDFNLPLLQETLAIIGKDVLKGVTKMLNTNDEFSFAADETTNTGPTVDEDSTELSTETSLEVEDRSKEAKNEDDDDAEVATEVSEQLKDESSNEERNLASAEGEEHESPLIENILKQDEEEIDYAKTLAQTAVTVAARKMMKKLGDNFKGVWD